MKPGHKARQLISPAGRNSSNEFEKVLLRLVKGGSERVAMESGQIDAVVDRTNGNIILLPAAQQSLIARKARLRKLLELSCDWSWEMDEHFRFTLCEGIDVTHPLALDREIIGSTIWEPSPGKMENGDWQPLRQQLESRIPFRNFEVRCRNHAGEAHYLSFSGTPVLDAEGQFKGFRGITRNISKRKLAEGANQELSRYAHPALDFLPASVAVLDSRGIILLANRAWRKGAVLNSDFGAGMAEGANYLESCAGAGGSGQVDGVAITAGIRQVIAAERDHFRYEYTCDSPMGRHWIMLNVTGAEGGSEARAVVTHEDISAQKRREQLLGLEYAVARCLADSDQASEAMKAVIRVICESQQWDCGRYFQLDALSGELCFSEAWGVPVASVERFLEQSRGLAFRPGAGLTGHVFLTGQPLWIMSDKKNSDMSPTALAPETGGEGAFIFPVISKDLAIGVLAFTSSTIRSPDNRMQQAMQSIARQLGRYLQGQQELDALNRSAVRFRKLVELSVDWYWEQDSNYRFSEYTGGGLSESAGVLGKTLWELPEVVLSDSEWIKHKAELAARWSFCEFEFSTLRADGQEHHYSISGEPLYDADGIFTGYCGTGVDITERKVAEIALRESQTGHRDS